MFQTELGSKTMQIKSIVAVAAIALVAGLGSASAGERFSILDPITVEPLTDIELDSVRGALRIFRDKDGDGFFETSRIFDVGMCSGPKCITGGNIPTHSNGSTIACGLGISSCLVVGPNPLP